MPEKDSQPPTSAQQKRKSYVKIIFIFVASAVIIPICVSLLSSLLDRKIIGPSEQEKHIETLLTAAEGKKETGKDCKLLCDIATPRDMLGSLISQAPPSKKAVLTIYCQCYDRKDKSKTKFQNINSLKNDFFNTNTLDAAKRLQKYVPILNEFDEAFFPSDYNDAKHFLKQVRNNQQAAELLIQTTNNKIHLLSQKTTELDCKVATSTLIKFKNDFNKYFSDSNPFSYLDDISQDYQQACTNRFFTKNINSTPIFKQIEPSQIQATPQRTPAQTPKTPSRKALDGHQLIRSTVRKNIDLTKTANRFGDVILHMNGGEIVTIVNENPPGWSFVRYEDKEGYLPNNVLMESK